MTKRASKDGAARKKPAGKRTRALVWVARGLVAVFFLASASLLGLVGVFSYYGRDLPKVSTLKHYDPPQTSRVVDRKGRLIAELFEERRTVVPMSNTKPLPLASIGIVESKR